MSGSQASRSPARSSGVDTCHVVRGEERVGHGPVQHRVAVRAAHGREAGVEVVRGELDVAHDDVRAAQPVDRATERREIERLGLERRVEADDLTPSVHAGVGATRAGQLDRVPQDAFEGRRQRAADGDHAGVGSEAREPAAVVRDAHADPRHGRTRSGYTSSMRAMGALSPWRGPSLRMRV